LVEDLTTDGRSKITFCRALREAGAEVSHVFVVFYYDIFPQSPAVLAEAGVTLHHLATWWDVLRVAKTENRFAPHILAEVEAFLHDPAGWSKAHGGADRTPD
jgi:orotate phosphoribosyltransferase